MNPYPDKIIWDACSIQSHLHTNHFSSITIFKVLSQNIMFKLTFLKQIFFSDSIFRNVRHFIALYLMDTSLPENAVLISKIMRRTVDANLYEAFLESAPQFILQSSIILRNGIISKRKVATIRT